MKEPKKNIYILGISCFYHDSAACLLQNGEIISAVQEERFTRIKHDPAFPFNAIKYCLKSKNIDLNQIDKIVYYEKPLLTFERLLETYLDVAPRGFFSFSSAMQVWIKEKLFIKSIIKKNFRSIQKEISENKEISLPTLLFSEHHLSHASAAFYPSPFKEAAILCMDGVGEWATTSAWIGDGKVIKPLWEINFPHSIGLLYSSFTYYCGFKVNSGEYKLMGLAPYGVPRFSDLIKNNLIDIKEDGSFRLNMSYFKFHRGFRMTSRKFNKLFGEQPLKKGGELKQFHMDIAASIQSVTEEIVIKLVKSLKKETNLDNLCLSGGVALNCVANGKIKSQRIFKNIWIQPASGDAGSALGSAQLVWHQLLNKKRNTKNLDSMKGCYLGCSFTNLEIKNYLKSINANFEILSDKDLFTKVAEYINSGKTIGWFSDAMEFGPRALGNRSIIGDPRNINMQRIMNEKIKFRESFRPFAPAILEEDVHNQFELKEKSPYMLLVAKVKKEKCLKMSNREKKLFGIEKLNIARSNLPAITHIDYSARIQTVNKETNPRFYKLIQAFKDLTGCPCIINTSFNVRGEPIVRTPQDAFRCFMRTNLDILILQNHILLKESQQKYQKDEKWMQEFELD